ncbi:MAG: aminotransferase [Rhodospirillales bacterium CG15_BIG_FIL_POST_REV_8_21_14_020_66_15]|nr:MAG: aminotransferase [Rhodospirillales bacterium CG15_BIG_FIL_POST_REV_8_21_14_020_66_15]
MVPLACQRHLFDIPADVAWFNCASRTPFLKSVAAAGEAAMRTRTQPWTLDPQALHDQAERLRARVAGLIGAKADDIAIQPAASYGLATAAANLGVARGQTVVVLEDQFPSNVFVWIEKARDAGARVVTVPRPADADWTAAVLDHLGGDTAVAALPPCHWVDGTVVDLAAVGDRCRDLGAALVVDATQWIGAMPFDVARVRPDFLVAAAYKWLLCPNGLSFLYAAPAHQGGRPLEHHDYNHPATGASIEGALVYDPALSPGARRFDVGQTYNQVLLPMAAAALEQVAAWTPEAVRGTLGPVMETILNAARDMGYATPAAGRGVAHMTALGKDSPPPAGMIAALAARGVHASLRGGRLRLAPHVYVSQEDVARLLGALETAWP